MNQKVLRDRGSVKKVFISPTSFLMDCDSYIFSSLSCPVHLTSASKGFYLLLQPVVKSCYFDERNKRVVLSNSSRFIDNVEIGDEFVGVKITLDIIQKTKDGLKINNGSLPSIYLNRERVIGVIYE